MTDTFSLERDGLRQAKPNKHHDKQHQASQNDHVDLGYRVRDPLKAGIVSTVHGEFIAHCLTASPSCRPGVIEIMLDWTSTRRHQSSLCYMKLPGGRLTKCIVGKVCQLQLIMTMAVFRNYNISLSSAVPQKQQSMASMKTVECKKKLF